VLFRQVENEGVLLHLPTGKYFNFSETSVLFWQAIQDKQPLTGVVEQILAEYEVEESQVLAELEVFLQTLLATQLIFLNSK
jgi:hypothetical protein